MLSRDEYRAKDAVGLADLVRCGKVTAQEVLEAAIAEIERLDPALNAVVMRNYEKAREDADAVDRAAPLAGVPFLAKDVNVHVAGFPTTYACRFFADAPVQGTDSLLVSRWRAAGMVVPGRTNTPEFATEFVCEPELYGPTCNPWDRTRTPGGSSGGAAAAVAARAQEIGREPSDGELGPLVAWSVAEAVRLNSVHVMQARGRIRDWQIRMARAMTGIDVLLTPVTAEPPPHTGVLTACIEKGLECWNERSWRFAPYTETFNVTGQPAMSIPLHQGADGLPIGMHLAGKVGKDARLLRLARQLEDAAPWIRRRPPQAR